MKVLAERITAWCNMLCPMEREQEIAVRYGLELLLENLIKLVGIFMLAGIWGKTGEAAIFCLVFCPFRMLAGGIHMKTSMGCFVFMLIIIGIGILGGEYLVFDRAVRWGLMIVAAVLCLLYAPRDTRKNPIVFESVRYKKKYMSVFFCLVSMAAVEWVAGEEIKVLAVLAILLEVATILPVTDYINETRFKKRREII